MEVDAAVARYPSRTLGHAGTPRSVAGVVHIVRDRSTPPNPVMTMSLLSSW